MQRPRTAGVEVGCIGGDQDAWQTAKALSRARLFAEGDDNRPTYINKLKDVIAKFPGTAAAKEAKKALDGLK